MLRISILPARQPLFIFQEKLSDRPVCMGTRSCRRADKNGIRGITEAGGFRLIVLIGFDTENTSEKVRGHLHHAQT